MSPLARSWLVVSPLVSATAGLALLAFLTTNAEAQTIGDYSRMQRDSIDKAMSPPGARPATSGASGSREALPPVSTQASSPERPVHSLASSMGVNGVFSSASRVVAEVVVDGRAYVLAVGERVPGLRWRVDAIAVDRVVFGRVDGSGRRDAGRQAVMTFALAPVPGGRP